MTVLVVPGSVIVEVTSGPVCVVVEIEVEIEVSVAVRVMRASVVVRVEDASVTVKVVLAVTPLQLRLHSCPALALITGHEERVWVTVMI